MTAQDNSASNGNGRGARARDKIRFRVDLTDAQVEALNRNRVRAGRAMMTKEEMMLAMEEVPGFAQSVRLAIELGLVPGGDRDEA